MSNGKTGYGLLVAALLLVGCGDDKKDNPLDSGSSGDTTGDTSIEVPNAYVFDSRFNQGESSVSYGGQVVRNLLLQDLKILIDNLGKSGAQSIEVQDLLNIYDYDDALNLETLTGTGANPALETRYSTISTGKDLVGKISSDPVIGYDRTADELVRGWFEIIATNSQNSDKLGSPAVYTTDEGVDLTQMINKVLIGAVPYYQSTGVYLQSLLERGNGEPRSEGNASTAMEHAWDEAFGYFGAARDYRRYSDEQLAGSVGDYTFDSNDDGRIDFRSEYNFGLSRNAAKRDKRGQGVDFTEDIFSAFLAGRTLIVNQASSSEIAQQRELAANGMEKVIAATVVHYINDTLNDMAALGTDNENRGNLNKHWAEMKGYTVALQYNPFGLIDEGQLRQLHGIMGQAPSYHAPGSEAYDTTVADFQRAKEILQGVYGFSSANMDSW